MRRRVVPGGVVARLHGLARLPEHVRDEAQARAREQLVRRERGQQRRRRRRAHEPERVRGRVRVAVVVVPGLLEKVEQVLAGHELEQQQQVGRGLERLVERNNVRVGR
jgi:hypothetical protein